MSAPTLFRRLLCDHGFHNRKSAEFVWSGDVEIDGKRNHVPYRLADYEVWRCECGDYFAEPVQPQKQARA